MDIIGLQTAQQLYSWLSRLKFLEPQRKIIIKARYISPRGCHSYYDWGFGIIPTLQMPTDLRLQAGTPLQRASSLSSPTALIQPLAPMQPLARRNPRLDIFLLLLLHCLLHTLSCTWQCFCLCSSRIFSSTTPRLFCHGTNCKFP